MVKNIESKKRMVITMKKINVGIFFGGCSPEYSVSLQSAAAVLEALPPPDCVFLGGSSGNLREILELVGRKNPSARIVAAAVTLETAAELTAWAKAGAREDWEAVALSAARSREAGSYHLMTAQNPVWLFCFRGSGRRERKS